MFALTMTVGIAVTVVLVELTGLVAGGIVVPAYVSLILSSPASLGMLLAMALAVMLALRLLAQAMPLYGTRRYGMSVLLGGVLNAGAQTLLAPSALPFVLPIEWTAFGYLVPGLIAFHFDRQGIVRTVLMIAIAAPLVRALVLLLRFF
jgi:poly-gamma-glutamate biosynthesis protein PgsC/CapC